MNTHLSSLSHQLLKPTAKLGGTGLHAMVPHLPRLTSIAALYIETSQFLADQHIITAVPLILHPHFLHILTNHSVEPGALAESKVWHRYFSLSLSFAKRVFLNLSDVKVNRSPDLAEVNEPPSLKCLGLVSGTVNPVNMN